jgi:hypothetical protein
MRTMKIAGSKKAAVAILALCCVATPAAAQELSEKSVRAVMEYAWSLTPPQFTTASGKTIQIDKSKKEQVLVPLDVASDVIRVGRLSAHAQVCNLPVEQAENHESLMQREQQKKKWTPQQLVYINQLHLMTVMLMTGKVTLVEKEGGKEAVPDKKPSNAQTCTAEQRQIVKDKILAYVKTGPALASNAPPPTTGSTNSPAAAQKAAPAQKK